MTATAPQPGSDWRDGFLFLGNHLALDLLNTRPVVEGELKELLPDFEALVRWYQAAGLLSPSEASKMRQQWEGSRRSRRTLEAVRGLRERLRKEVLDWEAGGAVRRATLDELNSLMAAHPMRTRLTATAGERALERWFDTSWPESLLAPLAESAAALFAQVPRERVRKCGNCVLHFYDTSKKGTRRWCSMQLCGNRLKVAAYAQRHRTAG